MHEIYQIGSGNCGESFPEPMTKQIIKLTIDLGNIKHCNNIFIINTKTILLDRSTSWLVSMKFFVDFGDLKPKVQYWNCNFINVIIRISNNLKSSPTCIDEFFKVIETFE